MTAISTCGFTRPSLAATRSLGRAGIPVAVAAPFRPALAMWSRFASDSFLVPHPELDAARFASSIAKELTSRYATCALPATDSALWSLSRWRDLLPVGAQRILPPHASVARALDFSALHDLAESVGVKCVSTIRVEPDESLSYVIKKAKKLELPFLIRPIIPWVEREDGTRTMINKRVVFTIAELEQLLRKGCELVLHGFLIESRPASTPMAYGAVCDNGVPFAEVCQVRLREEHPFAEVATAAQTITMDKKVRSISRVLLAALSWQGPAKIELVRLENGELRVVTIKGRLWGSVQLAINAGVDVPLLCYRLADGTAFLSRLVKARPNVQMKWTIGDLRQRLSSFFKGEKMGLKASLPHRQAQNLERYGDVMDWTDPMPFVYELQNIVRNNKAD